MPYRLSLTYKSVQLHKREEKKIIRKSDQLHVFEFHNQCQLIERHV